MYKINCSDCNASYIGQTKRRLEIRLNEHKKNIKRNVSECSVVSAHRINNNHKFNWQNPAILRHEKYLKKREVAEKDTDNLPNVYYKIIGKT